MVLFVVVNLCMKSIETDEAESPNSFAKFFFSKSAIVFKKIKGEGGKKDKSRFFFLSNACAS